MAPDNCKAGGIKTKMICTLGPSSSDADTIGRMVEAGMDVARINTGHADVDEMREYARIVREVGRQGGRRVGVMLDLQGPRLRVGPVQGGSVALASGGEFTISTEQKRGDAARVSVSYAGLPGDLKPGDRVFVDDGLIRMVVEKVDGPDVTCRVVEGGELRQGKGMNFPDSALSLAAFTDRDRHFLSAGLLAGVDWVAQSFVRTPGDVEEVIAAIREQGYDKPVLAKIEKREGVENIDAILEVAQGVMVARGDLGVELPTEDVPLIQKDIIAKSLRAAVPVVTATQMLESMVSSPRPTRAEASDIANAIFDGTDAIMLSAETAIGHYPVQAVETMARIAAKAEQAFDYKGMLQEGSLWQHRSLPDAIGYAACKIASDLGARAIVTITLSGYTPRLVARYRPEAPVVAVSASEEVINAVSLVWGVCGVVADLPDDASAMMKEASRACLARGLVSPGDLIVIAGGFLDEERGTTNIVHVHTVAAA